MTRTFIALELNEPLRRHLGRIIQRMAQDLPHIHWVDPTNIHLTLAFLGQLTDEELVGAMQAAEAAAQQAIPFVWRLSHPGVFDSLRHPRVIWMGIHEPSGDLQRLHRALNHELEQRGFAIEKRPFSPHLTLARIKVPLNPEERQLLQRVLAQTKIPASAPRQHVSQLSVMKSELLRSGAKYTHLGDYVLGQERAS